MLSKLFKNPYFLTTLIFLIIIGISPAVIKWRTEEYAFFLLLFLVVTMAIRIDDLHTKIGGPDDPPLDPLDPDESIHSQLNSIKTTLFIIRKELNRIQEQIDKNQNND